MCRPFWKGLANEPVSDLCAFDRLAVDCRSGRAGVGAGPSGAVARAAGWWLRALALSALVAALANPSLQEEERENLSDIVILVVDESASQGLGDRMAQTAEAVAAVEAEVAVLPNTELRIHRVGDGEEDAGTLALTVLAEALAVEPRARVAGAILITDGRVHDLGLVPNLPAPLQVLLTGRNGRIGIAGSW